MEESIGLLEEIQQEFSLEEKDLRTFPPLALAYIGDCAFELICRTVLVEHYQVQPEKLHKKATAIVKAESQAKLIEALLPLLTEEETSIYRRGRNTKNSRCPKNASVADYRKATGLEALMGFLYLRGENARMVELVHKGLALIGKEL